ncbi:hypothetical protein NIES39_J00850 [Arthrospira platensis NIES-39]|nr:hypothetical protein NIES39_J00850 [Arthrospira platensis NIES-39]
MISIFKNWKESLITDNRQSHSPDPEELVNYVKFCNKKLRIVAKTTCFGEGVAFWAIL